MFKRCYCSLDIPKLDWQYFISAMNGFSYLIYILSIIFFCILFSSCHHLYCMCNMPISNIRVRERKKHIHIAFNCCYDNSNNNTSLKKLLIHFHFYHFRTNTAYIFAFLMKTGKWQNASSRSSSCLFVDFFFCT